MYRSADAYFLIANYEMVLRDWPIINKYPADFIILDEAQRIKNYATKTAHAIKSLAKKHALVITGTPIENRLIDLYSIVGFIDPYFLAPLWEFSYQHCYFDLESKNKINGYYNLKNLKKRLQPILLRREKHTVLRQLPHISERDIPVQMHPLQEDYHASFAKGIASILSKKFITPFDMQKLMLLLTKMRVVCDSTNLIDHETHISPKLEELEHVILEKLDIHNTKRKIVIFSEWIRMNNIIGKMLRKNDIGYVELNSKVPVNKRGNIIKTFEEKPYCKVFLSTEAGGTGLNLQVADTIINFELPWNPSKKNQRIGRIDRLGQLSKKLNVINFITKNSIEEKIAAGLILKQDLFEGVLDPSSQTDSVDFSTKGRSQFLKQLEGTIKDLETPVPIREEEAEKEMAAEKVATAGYEPETEEEEEVLQPCVEAAKLDEEQAEIPVSKTESGTEPSAYRRELDASRLQEMEEVMQHGMGFLAGLYKLSTGKDLDVQGKRIEINRETGEVVMRFKL
jgi:SNF2 family DNA or RNA helicase